MSALDVRALTSGRVASPIGALDYVLREGRLVALEWEDHRDRLDRWLARRFGADGAAADSEDRAAAASVADRLARYFAGELDALGGIAVDPGGTPFQAEVWALLRGIAAGRTATYSGLARALGKPDAVRAVGAANGANPIALVVPCHRVVGVDGALTGYAGGLERKRWLLAHERAGQGSLFAGTIER